MHPQAASAEIRARADKARTEDPLNPINLFNIHWRKPDGAIDYFVMPHALTGVDGRDRGHGWRKTSPPAAIKWAQPIRV